MLNEQVNLQDYIAETFYVKHKKLCVIYSEKEQKEQIKLKLLLPDVLTGMSYIYGFFKIKL